MVALLSQEWLDLQRKAADEASAAPVGAVSALLRCTVSGAPEGNVIFTLRWVDGRLADAVLGDAASDDEVDLILTTTYETAVRLARGEVEPSAAYMQGDLKADGDMTRLLALLEATHRPEYQSFVARVAADTVFH